MHPITASPRQITLQNKASEVPFGQRIRAGGDLRLKVAPVLGMDEASRAALARLEQVANGRRVGVAGRFMRDAGVSHRLAALGVVENVEPEDFFRFQTIAIPYSGVNPKIRRQWEEAGHTIEDLTSALVRRTHVTLGLLRLEGAQTLVIGHHDDPETRTLAAGIPGTIILENTTDTARLRFAPSFGVVAQTSTSPRRATWLVQQLRMRWRDADVTYLDTISPAVVAREQALERLGCARVIIVGEPGEPSCQALMETATRLGKTARVIASAKELDATDFAAGEVGLTAGAFALDDTIREVAAVLTGQWAKVG